ncbi:MAG: hypothetical protein ACOCXH_06870 [Cyclobacteriaceae bacterium]
MVAFFCFVPNNVLYRRITNEAQPFFWGRFRKNDYRRFYQMKPFVKLSGAKDWQQVIEYNSRRIRKEVGAEVRGVNRLISFTFHYNLPALDYQIKSILFFVIP